MEAKIKIAVLCFDVSDIDIITVNNRLMETLKQNIDLPEKEKLRRLKEAKGGTWYDVEAVEYLTGPKEYSREQAFNIIREWTKEFTEKYGNYDFDGSYYDEIDEFIDKKLGTI